MDAMSHTNDSAAPGHEAEGVFRQWVHRLMRSVRPAASAVDTLPTAAAERRTFLDLSLQADFERDGYVIIDLLDDDALSELRTRYDNLDHDHLTEWPWVNGFETSLYDPRQNYRAQVLDDFDAVIAPALDLVLDDHRAFFANYVVKGPSADAVPPHVDWTFLDEDRFSSATVWCPLIDTNAELRNGALGVVVGSHRRIDFLRIVNLPSFDRCTQAVADLERRVPTVNAGQAIIMDNRVVHFSIPNETDDWRVAAACVVGPTEADLHHYWFDDDGDLIRFDLDRSFYLSYTIGQPADADGILNSTVVHYDDARSQ